MTRDQLVLTLLHAQDPGAVVWRPGMAEWVPAGAVRELTIVPASPAVSRVDASFEANRQRRIVRNAKQNAVAMFVLSILCATFVPAGAAATIGEGTPFSGRNLSEAPDAYIGFGCFMWLFSLVALFAAIYLPRRWTVMNSLSPVYRWLGLIGGFGLIAEWALMLIALAIGAVFA